MARPRNTGQEIKDEMVSGRWWGRTDPCRLVRQGSGSTIRHPPLMFSSCRKTVPYACRTIPTRGFT